MRKQFTILLILVFVLIGTIVAGVLALYFKSNIFLYISWLMIYLLAFLHGRSDQKTKDSNLIRKVEEEFNLLDRIKHSDKMQYDKEIFEKNLRNLIEYTK